MKPDKHIEHLLRRWGALHMTEYLYYPTRCAYLREYRPKGYKELPNDIDYPEVERLSLWMPWNLSSLEIACLRVRYRQRIKNKRRAAKRLFIPEHKYREIYNQAIRAIQGRF